MINVKRNKITDIKRNKQESRSVKLYSKQGSDSGENTTNDIINVITHGSSQKRK
ncbi:MAG: hypothetical protein HDR00_11075 [Lachnospiraceae bacterium]|nr:hypothetical protein [Lachnospiraceae bacterium]